MEDAVLKFGFKVAVMIVTARDINQAPTKFKNIISYYVSITQAMVDSRFEHIWANNSGAGLGHHPTADCGAALDVIYKR